jgi:hypothetical protein
MVPKLIDWENLKRPIYERLPGETTKAYGAFEEYRGLSKGDRTITKAAEKYGRSRSVIVDWSIQWHWARRIEAFDEFAERERLDAQVGALRDMAERQALIGATLIKKAMERLVGVEPGTDPENPLGVDAIDPSTLDAGDIARLAEAGTKIERLAREADKETHDDRPVELQVKVAFDVAPVYPAGAVGAGVKAPPTVIEHRERPQLPPANEEDLTRGT